MFAGMMGAPWDPNPGSGNAKIPSSVRTPDEGDSVIRTVEGMKTEMVHRRMQIETADVRRWGATPRC